MTEQPLRLREIAALSWTAARTRRDHDHTEENIRNLQRAVDITRRWLVEVEAEIFAHLELREKSSECSSGASSEGSSCKRNEDEGNGTASKCCLANYLKAFKAARTPSTDSEELKLLGQMHVGFSARVVEAERQIAKLSSAGGGRIAHGHPSEVFVERASSVERTQEPQQLALRGRSPHTSAHSHSDSKDSNPSSKHSTHSSRGRSATQPHNDSHPRTSGHRHSKDGTQVGQDEKPTSGRRRRTATSPSGRKSKGHARTIPSDEKFKCHVKTGRVSAISIHDVKPIEAGLEHGKNDAFRPSASKVSREVPNIPKSPSRGTLDAAYTPARRSENSSA